MQDLKHGSHTLGKQPHALVDRVTGATGSYSVPYYDRDRDRLLAKERLKLNI